MIDPAEHPRYSISVAAELAGMHPQTLRMYDAKGLVCPRRTPAARAATPSPTWTGCARSAASPESWA